MECGAAARANFGFRWLSTATHGMRGPQLDDPIWTLPNATNMLPPPALVAPTIAKPLTVAIPSRLGFPGIADTAIPHRQACSRRFVVLGRSKMTSRRYFFDIHLPIRAPWSPCQALPLPHWTCSLAGAALVLRSVMKMGIMWSLRSVMPWFRLLHDVVATLSPIFVLSRAQCCPLP